MNSGDADTYQVRLHPRIADIPATDWDACAGADNPFLSHRFLLALEDAGTIGGRSGWMPQHASLLSPAGQIVAVAPMYLKAHSYGEYVFDHGWAQAYERAGGQYYPKLQVAVPFTPVPGRRLLVRQGADANVAGMLLNGLVQVAKRFEVSSLHITFCTEIEWQACGAAGLLQRTGEQFHWENRDYGDFEDFLTDLASRKRKQLKRERRSVADAGIEIEVVEGGRLTTSHCDIMYGFYMDTGSRKWGTPYLNRAFFRLLPERLADQVVLMLARREGRYIAGALNFRGSDTLYGRYWGANEYHDNLHFELCYYQAIDYAIRHRLARVEAGAQGPHKLARGYLPRPTYSAHWIADAGFRRAVANFLQQERAQVAEEIDYLEQHSPFRHETD